jgi:hypothetical protein
MDDRIDNQKVWGGDVGARGLRALFIALVLVLALVVSPAAAQKTDVVTMRNGDTVLGEIKWLDVGILEFSTDAMSTVNVKWSRIITAQSDKRFEITLSDGTIHFGSLKSTASDSIVVVTEDGRFPTPTQSIVRMNRMGSRFREAVDGEIGVGFGFTQQNSKIDANLDGEIRYPRLSNLSQINFGGTYGAQEGTDDILRLNGDIRHIRQYGRRWLYLGFAEASHNSQLDLAYRAGGGAGWGRLIADRSRYAFGAWIGAGFLRERYTEQKGANTVPGIGSAQLQVFIWDPLKTTVSSTFTVIPILSDLGRWRLTFLLSLQRELIKDVYLKIALDEQYDSRPPLADASKNDFNVTVSIGWSF